MAQRPSGLKAEERAEVVVTRLERFIRDHRTLTGGVSFRKWQDMAKTEIADLLREIETEQVREGRALERTLMVVGVGLATIGFWGTVLALSMAPDRVIAGVLTLLGGVIALWGIGALGLRSPFKRFQTDHTRITLDRARMVNRKVSELEHQLKKRKKALEKELDAMPDED